MYKFRKEKINEEKEDIPRLLEGKGKKEKSKETPYKLEICPNQRIAFKKNFNNGKYYNEREEEKETIATEKFEEKKYKHNMDKNDVNIDNYKFKSHLFGENKKTSANDFIKNNKKLRYTNTEVNNDKMKYESELIDNLLKMEKDNVRNYLNKDLAEIYNNINNENYFFKNNIFLANVDNVEKKTAILDKMSIIPYNCTEDISYKIEKFPRTSELIKKYEEKTKNLTENV